MADVEIDEATAREIAKKVADLTVQAIMFDMDIDLETLSLVPKRNDTPEPLWLKRWKEKNQNADRQPRDYEGGADGRR